MIGVDGCKQGYMIAVIKNKSLSVSYACDLSTLKDSKELILIDIPIGCPCTSQDIRPEPFIRKMVTPRKASVFNVLALDALHATTYAEAKTLNRLILNKGLSRQSFSLAPYIREVNTFVLTYPNVNIHESFPELIFTQLNQRGCQYSKHTQQGHDERIELLIKNFPWIKNDLLYILGTFTPRLHTDVIDAVVLACAAFHIQHYGYQTIPEHPQHNCQGIEMKMMALLC